MSRQFLIILGIGLAAAGVGCNNAPEPAVPVASSADEDLAPDSVEALKPEFAAEDEPRGIETPEPAEEVAAVEEAPAEVAPETTSAEIAESHELELEGIRFVVPGGWKQVKPQTKIVEAEFEVPRIDGDEFDGRLTMMSSMGDPQDVISNRTAEFVREPGSGLKIDKLPIDKIEATWVDLQGEWKGTAFSLRKSEPRPDYRMLLVIIPFTERSAFYVKLTGPRETVNAREDEFRAFVQSAEITIPQRESPER